jgi:hypothetical protein
MVRRDDPDWATVIDRLSPDDRRLAERLGVYVLGEADDGDRLGAIDG